MRSGDASFQIDWRFLTAALLLAASVFIPNRHEASGADRTERRFQQLLEGRHDLARQNAMRSIPRDFQARRKVFPLVIESLQKLQTDRRYQAAEQGDPQNIELPDGIAMMLDFVGTLTTPEATEALESLLDDQRRSWTMAVINVLSKYGHTAAIGSIADLAHSDAFKSSYGFRFTVARALVKLDHPDAWEALARLYATVDGQLAHRLERQFVDVTLHNFDDDEQRFAAWKTSVGLTDGEADAAEPVDANEVDALPKKMTLQPVRSASAFTRARLAPSKYYGIDIFAKKILFVIDRSGSMNDGAGSRSRIEQAKFELLTAVSGLEPDCEFGILVFDDTVRSWNASLVPATDVNKTKAGQFVRNLSAGSRTNTYGALRMALDFDEELEAIFLLTDGTPTTGRLVNPVAILNDVLRRNETHHITINAIGIAVNPGFQGFLRSLVEPSEGEFREVR